MLLNRVEGTPSGLLPLCWAHSSAHVAVGCLPGGWELQRTRGTWVALGVSHARTPLRNN